MLVVVGMLFLLRANGTSSPSLIMGIRENPLVFYGLLGFTGFGLIGMVLGIKRLFVYALLAAVLMVGGHFLGMPNSVPFLVLGGAILLIGVVLLISFIHKNPVIKEDDHANR